MYKWRMCEVVTVKVIDSSTDQVAYKAVMPGRPTRILRGQNE